VREFLLSIASPQAVSWAGFIILGIALVGEAGLGVVPIKWERLHKELAFVFAVLAAGGYAIERIGDDAVLGKITQKADQAELALQKFREPRSISQDAAAKIIAEMQKFPKTPVVFGVVQEAEPIALMERLSAVLISAGWVEQEWKGGDIVLNRGGGHPQAGVTYVKGVYVQADQFHAPDFGPIVVKLAALLSQAGIDAMPEIGRMPPNTNNDAIRILIGQKP
jgi:hypothetical protein